MNKYIVTIFLILAGFTQSTAQELNRSLIREGITNFKDSAFVNAEIAFRRAYQEKATDTALFNITTTLHAQERYEESIEELDRLIRNASDKVMKAKAYYNKANALVRLEKLEESLEEYKNALRNNPADHEARYNFLMVKRLVEQQPPQQDQQDKQDKQDKQDQEKEENQDKQDQKDKKDQGDKGDKQDQNESSDQNKNDDQENEGDNSEKDDSKDKDEQDQDEDDQNGEPQPKEGKLSREDALRLLQALEEAEEKTQEKVKAKKIKGGVRTNEKDW